MEGETHIYSVKTPHENPRDAVVEKRGVVVSFTLGELDGNAAANAKMKKQCEGMITINAAKMKNVEEHHPFVLTMPGEDLVAAHIYAEAQGMVKEAQRQLDAINKQIVEDAAEAEEILKQLPELAKAPKVEAADKKTA